MVCCEESNFNWMKRKKSHKRILYFDAGDIVSVNKNIRVEKNFAIRHAILPGIWLSGLLFQD